MVYFWGGLGPYNDKLKVHDLHCESSHLRDSQIEPGQRMCWKAFAMSPSPSIHVWAMKEWLTKADNCTHRPGRWCNYPIRLSKVLKVMVMQLSMFHATKTNLMHTWHISGGHFSQKKSKGEGPVKKKASRSAGESRFEIGVAMADKSESLGDFTIVRLFSPFKHFFFLGGRLGNLVGEM